jgi:hypothetical protein
LHADNQQPQSERSANGHTAGGPTILVADDMSIVREPIAASLRAADSGGIIVHRRLTRSHRHCRPSA